MHTSRTPHAQVSSVVGAPATIPGVNNMVSRRLEVSSSFETTCPDTITTFDLSGFSGHSDKKVSLAVADTYYNNAAGSQSLKVFKPVFAELTLPYSLIRNEEASLSATVFNYHDGGEMEFDFFLVEKSLNLN